MPDPWRSLNNYIPIGYLTVHFTFLGTLPDLSARTTPTPRAANTRRAALMEANPDMRLAEISKLIGAEVRLVGVGRVQICGVVEAHT